MSPTSQDDGRAGAVTLALASVMLPPGMTIRPWQEADFSHIQRLASLAGWSTPTTRPDEVLAAWQTSWPALVAEEAEQVVGFVRALTDGAITMYIAELLVSAAHQRKGIGTALLEVCHHLYPSTRIDLLSVEAAARFYTANGFQQFRGFRKSYR